MQEKEIKKLVLNRSSNGNTYVRLWTTDMDLVLAPIDIYFEEKVLFLLLTKTVGDTIQLEKNGRYWNVLEDNSKKDVQRLLKNINNSLEYLQDEARVTVTLDEMQNMANDFLSIFTKTIKIVDEYIKENKITVTAEDRERMIYSFANKFNNKFNLYKEE